MLRYSLSSLLLLVVLVALGAAALAYATEVWVNITSSAMFVLLLLATLTAVHAHGRLRWFANGFAIMGWLYLLMLHPLFDRNSERDLLYTDTVLSTLYASLHGDDSSGDPMTPAEFVRQSRPSDVGGFAESMYPWADDESDETPSLRDFAMIGHSLWAILLASVAGLFACVLRSHSERSRTTDT